MKHLTLTSVVFELCCNVAACNKFNNLTLTSVVFESEKVDTTTAWSNI